MDELLYREFESVGTTTEWKSNKDFKRNYYQQDSTTRYKLIATGNPCCHSFYAVMEVTAIYNKSFFISL